MTPASYPTKKIGDNARAFRQLGLGYTNLGSLLMCQGVAYDSDDGRAWAGGHHGPHAGRGLCPVGARRGPRGRLRRLRRGQGGAGPGGADAPRRRPRPARQRRPRQLRPSARGRGRSPRRGRGPRPVRGPPRRAGLPQRPGERDRPDRHDQLHDGRPDHGHRAGDRAGELQDPGRRRLHEAREHRRRARAHGARLRGGRSRGDPRPRGRHRRPSRARRAWPTSTSRCSTAPSASPAGARSARRATCA